MTTLQAVFMGMMLAWTPSVVLLAFLLGEMLISRTVAVDRLQ